MTLNRPLYEPPHDNTNKMACAPSEDSDHPGHPPSLIRVAKGPSFLHADSEDSDQTGRMPRLICVLTGRTSHFVGFDMSRLNYENVTCKPVFRGL